MGERFKRDGHFNKIKASIFKSYRSIKRKRIWVQTKTNGNTSTVRGK